MRYINPRFTYLLTYLQESVHLCRGIPKNLPNRLHPRTRDSVATAGVLVLLDLYASVSAHVLPINHTGSRRTGHSVMSSFQAPVRLFGVLQNLNNEYYVRAMITNDSYNHPSNCHWQGIDGHWPGSPGVSTSPAHTRATCKSEFRTRLPVADNSITWLSEAPGSSQHVVKFVECLLPVAS